LSDADDFVPRREVELLFDRVKSELRGLRTDITGRQDTIIKRLDTANDNMAKVKREHHQMEGAINVLKWVVATSLGGMATGAAVAGVIVAVLV
jgi:hypothetical protein